MDACLSDPGKSCGERVIVIGEVCVDGSPAPYCVAARRTGDERDA